jgi:hypothetical protein
MPKWTQPLSSQEANIDYFFDAIVEAGQIHGDLTGRLPTTSYHVNTYVMVIYAYDRKTTTTEPIREFTDRIIKPCLQYLDNECSHALQLFLTQEDIQFQLAPPYMHERNVVKCAIQMFKNHFIAGLCLVDKVITQAIITLHLLRQSIINPHMSAHAQLNGHYDFRRTSMAPPGARIIAHMKPDQRASWAPHGVDVAT